VGKDHKVPIEYVFDNTDKRQKKEIERVLAHGETLHPGAFDGHYSFRNRGEIPGLQCADLFAWTCYQRSISYLYKKPISPFAQVCWKEFSTWKKGEAGWAGTWYAQRAQLEDWVRRVHADKEEMKRINALD
jgi:hypothetical protein